MTEQEWMNESLDETYRKSEYDKMVEENHDYLSQYYAQAGIPYNYPGQERQFSPERAQKKLTQQNLQHIGMPPKTYTPQAETEMPGRTEDEQGPPNRMLEELRHATGIGEPGVIEKYISSSFAGKLLANVIGLVNLDPLVNLASAYGQKQFAKQNAPLFKQVADIFNTLPDDQKDEFLNQAMEKLGNIEWGQQAVTELAKYGMIAVTAKVGGEAVKYLGKAEKGQ
jgi:hypothetical protein